MRRQCVPGSPSPHEREPGFEATLYWFFSGTRGVGRGGVEEERGKRGIKMVIKIFFSAAIFKTTRGFIVMFISDTNQSTTVVIH